MKPLTALRAILDAPDLTANQRLVLVALLRFADERGECFPAVATLASRTGLSERTVQRTLRELEKLGLVAVEERRGRTRTSTYRLCLEAGKGVTVTPFEGPKRCQGDGEKVSGATKKGVSGDRKRCHSDTLTAYELPRKEEGRAKRAPASSSKSSASPSKEELMQRGWTFSENWGGW
ncbi:hypothetical protein HRbin29_00647 [bacterium HR29]|nr:hypothetical protein HRbin29_00647 [bacterium HR29]